MPDEPCLLAGIICRTSDECAHCCSYENSNAHAYTRRGDLNIKGGAATEKGIPFSVRGGGLILKVKRLGISRPSLVIWFLFKLIAADGQKFPSFFTCRQVRHVLLHLNSSTSDKFWKIWSKSGDFIYCLSLRDFNEILQIFPL
jgi:hypothetical protein